MCHAVFQDVREPRNYGAVAEFLSYMNYIRFLVLSTSCTVKAKVAGLDINAYVE
jgi:hypothetical protein